MAGKKKPPRVKGEKPVTKADKIETQRRVRVVLDWILNDQMANDIVTAGLQKWGVSERQMYRYINEANTILQEVNEDKLIGHVNFQVMRAKRALRQLDEKHKTTPAGVFAIKAMLEHIAKIQGLYIQKVEVSDFSKKVGFADLRDKE